MHDYSRSIKSDWQRTLLPSAKYMLPVLGMHNFVQIANAERRPLCLNLMVKTTSIHVQSPFQCSAVTVHLVKICTTEIGGLQMKWAVHPDPSTRRRLPESEEASACRRSIGQAWRCPMLALALSITSSSESQNSHAVSRSLQHFADPCRTSQNMRNFWQIFKTIAILLVISQKSAD